MPEGVSIPSLEEIGRIAPVALIAVALIAAGYMGHRMAAMDHIKSLQEFIDWLQRQIDRKDK